LWRKESTLEQIVGELTKAEVIVCLPSGWIRARDARKWQTLEGAVLHLSEKFRPHERRQERMRLMRGMPEGKERGRILHGQDDVAWIRTECGSTSYRVIHLLIACGLGIFHANWQDLQFVNSRIILDCSTLSSLVRLQIISSRCYVASLDVSDERCSEVTRGCSER
jgi:hypothetical protein